MHNILLLGGTGFIGKNIIESFSTDRNCNLIVLTRSSLFIEKELFFAPNVTLVTGEFKNIDFIKDIIDQYDINVIIHLISSLIPSSSDEVFYDGIQNIIIPTFKLIDFIANKKIKFIFFSSGGTIYGNAISIIKETNNLNPINNYGHSKLMIENYINLKKNNSAIDYIVVRPSNVYGKYQSFDGNQGFISVAINKISNGIPIEIWGDGNSVRDYIHVNDVVFIINKLINQSVSNVTLNISTGIGKSLIEIITLIEKRTRKKAIINFNSKRGVDANAVVLDNSKLQFLLTQKNITVEEGIELQIEYFNTIVPNAD